jgi:phage-related protein
VKALRRTIAYLMIYKLLEKNSIEILLILFFEPENTDVMKPITDVMESITDVMKPITDVMKPITDVMKPITDVLKSITDVIKSITRVMKPITDVINIISHMFFSLFYPKIGHFNPPILQ